MPRITLPDGSVREFDNPVSGAELADDIGPGLAKAAMAIRINGELDDLSTVIDRCRDRHRYRRGTRKKLWTLSAMTRRMYWQKPFRNYSLALQVTIGPNIENGFYYDFARDEPFSSADLETIEAKMREIIDRNDVFTKEVWAGPRLYACSATWAKLQGGDYRGSSRRRGRQDLPPRAGSICVAGRTCLRLAGSAELSS